VTDAAFHVNEDELAHSNEEDFSVARRRMEELAYRRRSFRPGEELIG